MGSVLGNRYELRGVLGRGGMAEVRDGWDTQLSRPVAIKLLYPALAADAGLRRRFEDEARAAAALNHPNVVAIHDSGEYHGQPFIVMERLPGRSLADEIAAGPMRVERVRAVLAEILSALAAAHAAGILHRDIKPGNVLISPSGAAKLADFGIAKTDGGMHTQTGQIVGTMGYLSPQRIMGRPATVADDIYAAGVLGYEALTGQQPFRQDNPAAMVRAILDARPVPVEAVRPDVDPALAAVIRTATAPEPGHRFPDAIAMRAAVTGEAPPTVQFSPAPRPATKAFTAPVAFPESAPVYPPARRSRLPLVLGAAAALLLAATLAVVLLVSHRPQQQPLTPVNTTSVPTPTTFSAPPMPTTTAAEDDEEPGRGKDKGKEPPGKKKGHPHG